MNESNYLGILENLNDAVLVHDGALPLYYNQRLLTLLGFSTAEEYVDNVKQDGLFRHVHADDKDRVVASHNDRVSGKKSKTEYYSIRLLNKDNAYHWVELKISSIQWNQKLAVLVCVNDLDDIINRSNSNTHFQTLFDHVLNFIPAVVTLTTVSDGIYHHVNDTFEKTMGYDKKALIGYSSYELNIWPNEEERLFIRESLFGGKAVEDYSCSVMTKEGTVIPASIWARLIHSEPEDMILLVGFDRTDEVERLRSIEKLNKSLHLLASTDSLTGLLNRRHFFEKTKGIATLCRRSDIPMSVLICDIDKFKLINDSYGHNIGDNVIKAFSEAVTNSIREEDILARWGGEEFVAFLPNTNLQQAAALAERIRQQVETINFTFDDTCLAFTASFGVTQLPEGLLDIEDAIRLADIALYNAKGSGRNRVCKYTD